MDTQPRASVRTINAGAARVKFGQLLDEVHYKGDQFIIERDGRPMAAVIPLSLLEKVQKIQNQPKPQPDTIKVNKHRSRKGKS